MAWSDIYRRTFDEDRPTNNCPECGGGVVTNSRETRCEDCGLVLAESPIHRGPEWRHFDDSDESRSERGRHGPWRVTTGDRARRSAGIGTARATSSRAGSSDGVAASHRFDVFANTVYVVDAAERVDHVERLDPGEFPDWVAYVRDKRPWRDLRYRRQKPFEGLLDQPAEVLEAAQEPRTIHVHQSTDANPRQHHL